MKRAFSKSMRTSVKVCTALVCASLVLAGCVQTSKKKKGGKQGGAPFQIRYFNANPFSNQALSQRFSSALSRVRLSESVTTGLNEDSLWAIAECNCSPNFAGVYTQFLVQSRGALPAPLVPIIREEVRSDPKLKALLSLPDGVQSIAGTLAGLFVNDEEISAEIQKGLDEKLGNALGTNQTLSSRIKYNFDLYPSPFVNLGDSSTFNPKTFNTSEQASKWAFIFSLDNMWGTSGNGAPLALGDHSLQLLATSITMAEWTYAFGIDEASSGAVYGGLTMDPRQGVASPLTPADPRKNSDASGVMSGNYNITFPDKGTLQLVTSVKEQWARATETPSLDEQARVWAATARAYGRLKPSARRGVATRIFAPQTGIFPTDAHQMPLAFLPGMAELLKTPFIEDESREIRGAAKIQGANDRITGSRATLKALARMGRAMQAWITQTETIEQDALSPEITQMIAESRPTIKDGMRLAVQGILDNHTEDSVRNTRLGGIAMVMSKQNFNRPPIEEVAEALAIMSHIDLTTLQNQPGVQTDLNKKIIALHHWFAAEYLADVASGQFRQELKPEAAFWTYQALANFAKYPPEMTRAPWLKDALANVESSIIRWDQQFR